MEWSVVMRKLQGAFYHFLDNYTVSLLELVDSYSTCISSKFEMCIVQCNCVYHYKPVIIKKKSCSTEITYIHASLLGWTAALNNICEAEASLKDACTRSEYRYVIPSLNVMSNNALLTVFGIELLD